MPGIFAHSGLLWGTAREARERATTAGRENPEAWPTDAIVAIVLASATAEAFVNELTESVAMHRDFGHHPEQIPAPLCAFADALKEIEEAHGNINLKYLIASQTLSGSMFDKGTNPYQDFVTLIKLRNDIMHLKQKDTFNEPEDGPVTVQPPKYIKDLQKKGLARNPAGINLSWLNMLMTAEKAGWACDTAHNIILAVLNMIPEGPGPAPDSVELFRNTKLQGRMHGTIETSPNL